ncbi:MAG: IS66 family transposase [bacterium]|nr:IS66 family transposase [bacterium]
MASLPDEWKEEFARLRSERDLAFRELAALRSSMDELAQMVAGQNDRLDQIVSMLRRREAQLKRAEAEVRKLRRKLGLDDPDPEPVAESAPSEDAASDATDEEAASTAETEGSGSKDGASSSGSGEADPSGRKRKRKRKRSRGGRRPPPKHLPSDTEHHEVCACGRCGGRVFKRDVLVTYVYTAVESYLRRRRIERERVICADLDCGQPTTARMPPMPCERALYDCKFLAWLVVMKFVLLVPLDRIRLHLLSQGVDIAMGSLVHLIERASDLAAPIDGEHLKQLRAGAYFCFDGTGLKALVLGQDKAWDGYMEVFTRDELTVFQFSMTKHADRLQERMNEFAGILVCDAESRNAAGAPDATLSFCNAHAVRKMREAKKVQPCLAAQGGRFLKALYDLEDEADELGLTGARRVAFRQRRSRRVLHRFRQWLEAILTRGLPPSDLLRKTAKYYLNNWAGLTRFVDFDIPIDNNASEREFQRHAKLRYASLFVGSEEGGHRWATLFGIVRTAQKYDLDVQAYLTWMFERRGSHRKEFAMSAMELTPAAYRDRGAQGALAAA